MSYEKVKVLGIREVVKKSTGEIHRFLQVEVLRSYDAYLNSDHIKLLDEYKRFEGREVLMPASWGEYQGRPSLNLDGDGRLLPFAASSPPVSVPSSAGNTGADSSFFKKP